MYIFISHSSTDYKIAEKVCKYIEENGHQCFLAPRDIRPGYVYAQELVEGIDRCDCMLVLLSAAANESPHVLREIERAVSKKIKIFVYRLEEITLSKPLEYFLMSHQWLDYKKENYEEILRCIVSGADKTDRLKKRIPQRSKENKRMLLGTCIILLVFCMIFFIGKCMLPNETEDAELQKTVLLPGDTIIFGKYRNVPIEWRVLKVSEDGKEAVVVAKNILTMKAFDAAESGKYNWNDGKDYWGADISEEDIRLQHNLRGSNDWSTSNIRTWLNAKEENVKYTYGEPKRQAMSELKNGYDKEPGFLSNFTPEEQERILFTQLSTNGNITTDRVFLLSKEETGWFYEANVSLQAIPTEEALQQDMTDWYEIYALEMGTEDFNWWLRDTDGISQYEAYMVCNSNSGGKIKTECVGLEGFGIRPAMTIKADAGYIQKK